MVKRAAAAAAVVLLFVVCAAFAGLAQTATSSAACAPTATSSPSDRPERPAGGGVFVGGRWHYPEQPGPRWTPGRIARAAASYGLPGRTFAQIARGESGNRPFVVQHDPGDGMVGFGFFQFTPNSWSPTSPITRKLQQLGGQRGLQDVRKQFELARFMYVAAGHSISPWHGTGYVTDWSTPRVTTPLPALLEASCATTGGAVAGSPKHIIDTVVLPISRACGVPRTVAENDAANEAHRPLTSSGYPSDHKGPPEEAWAADMSNGFAPTPEMDCLADRLAQRFGYPNWSGSGLVDHTARGYRFQLIWRAPEHYNHVHFGVKLV